MDARQAISDYDAVRVAILPDERLVENIRLLGPTSNTDGDWWRACVLELAKRHPVQLTASEMVADHRGVRS